MTQGWSEKETKVKSLLTQFVGCLQAGSPLTDLKSAFNDSTLTSISHVTQAETVETTTTAEEKS